MMWRRKLLRYLAVFLWISCVAFSPRTVSNAHAPQGDRGAASREGLYKSSLTDATFGILGFQLFESSDGRKQWNIRSKFAELKRAESYTVMQQVEAEFMAEKTGNAVHTTSDWGSSYVETELVDLKGNVVIRSARGYEFRMDKMQYDGTKHEFRSNDMVNMKGPSVEKPTMYLRGRGLLAHINNEHFILRRTVNARRQLQTGEWIRVSSRSGEFFTDENRAVFIGQTESKLPNTTVKSDVFEISMSDSGELLHATGNVELLHNDRVGRSDRALIEVGSGQIVLDGNGSIGEDENKISGERIVLHTADDRVEVQKASGRVRDQ